MAPSFGPQLMLTRPVSRDRHGFYLLKVFCDETVSALKTHPDIVNNVNVNVDGTVCFLEKFINFWKILNVVGSHMI